MKKYFLSLFLAVILLLPLHQSLAATDYKVIKVAAFDNYPVIFKDTDGIIKGLYVDVLTEIGSKEKISFEYVFGTWAEGLERIKSGAVDMLTSVGYTDDRSTFMDYTKNPILTVWGELYIPEWSDIDGILKVADKKIGIMTGDVNGKNFQDLISKFNINCQFVEFSSYNDVFKAVADRQVDAGVAGTTYGNSNKTKYGLKSSGVVFNPLSLYFTTAKGKNQDLILTLDKYLAGWKLDDNSFLRQMEQKWLNDSVNVRVVAPAWIYIALAVMSFILLVTFVFIVLLNRQVKRKVAIINQQGKEKPKTPEDKTK